MKITEKGFYRTRGGDVAFVYSVDVIAAGFVMNRDIECWTLNGFSSFDNKRKRPFDLVELIKPYSEIEKELNK